MRRIQYLTLFSTSAQTRTAKKPIVAMSILTDNIGKIHGPVSLQQAVIKTAK